MASTTPDAGSFAWTSLLPLVLSLFGGSSGSSGSSSSVASDAEMKAILAAQQQRMKLQNPLYEEATQLARSLMPNSSRPASYTLPTIGTNPGAQPTPTRPKPTKPDDPYAATPVAQAVKMLASGIAPATQATLFRR